MRLAPQRHTGLKVAAQQSRTQPSPRRVRPTPPAVHPPRLRLTDDRPPLAGVTYDSENYAMLNRPIETGRHFRRITRFLAPRSDQRLLEVGCGRGWLTRRVQEHCPATFGVDVNPRSIEHGVAPNLSVMDAVKLCYDDEQFDHVYSFHAIEHIPDAAAALCEMRRVLVPGGRALLVYPAEPLRGLYAMPGAWIGFGNPLLARKLHVHKFTPRRMRRLAACSGLTHVTSALDLLITPQFITVLEKARRRA
ncbi:MAG: class I SAM-dependent methyltransferase [Gemmatimonadota bacterium]|nr:class I SAM-dependent methyltransferase [Gemmatimonadota bacterium]